MPGFIGARNTGNHGHQHQQARAAAFALLPEYSRCARGGELMWKWAKDKHGKSDLHYDHNNSNSGYLGFSCGAHNREDGARKGQAAQRQAGRRAKATGIVRERRVCTVCSKPFLSWSATQTRCSYQCRTPGSRTRSTSSTPRHRPSPIERTCIQCGTTFTTTRHRQQACSRTCSTQRNRSAMRDRYHTDPVYRAATQARGRAAVRAAAPSQQQLFGTPGPGW